MDTYVLGKTDIDAMAGTPKTHFLNPQAQRLNKSLGEKRIFGQAGLPWNLVDVDAIEEPYAGGKQCSSRTLPSMTFGVCSPQIWPIRATCSRQASCTNGSVTL
ncbi:MAG: hypothetical protein CSB44_01600 [Gammaproteobacteria bacterium]|nr:MAG: hypothetical protein CSB44_01600 [Gammaproteobacteria bacterium]